MKKVLIALILIVFSAGGVFSLLRPPEKFPSRPDISPKQASTGDKEPRPNPAPLPAMLADRILIEKATRRLTLFREGKPINRFRVALGREPEGKKSVEGDGKTPEGCYIIDYRNENSRFHKALHISYPNSDDRRRAAMQGVPPGSDIMFHGPKKGMGRIG